MNKTLSICIAALLIGACVATTAAGDAPKPDSPGNISQADWLARAAVMERRGDWKNLLGLGQLWTRVEPANANAWFVLGRAYAKVQRHPEAIAAYRQTLELEPGDIHALINLGNLYRAEQQMRAALDSYRAAAQIDPAYLPAWHNLGQTFYLLKGASGVTQALQRLNASDPALAEAWRVLAIEYSVTRNQRVAQKAIGILRRLDADQQQRMFAILFDAT
jgi:tetratricopeptide (TPR) repeat protein